MNKLQLLKKLCLIANNQDKEVLDVVRDMITVLNKEFELEERKGHFIVKRDKNGIVKDIKIKSYKKYKKIEIFKI